MQISMNQGPRLSERNWLTEGCHPCAWKMMDPICKLLLCPPALYLLYHWLFSKVEISWLLKNNKRFGKIGTLPAISSNRAGTSRGSVGFQWWQGLIIIRDFVFPSSFQLVSLDINKMKPISANLEKEKIYTSKILAFACWTDNILFLAIVMLGFPGKGIHCEGTEQIKRKIPFNRNKEAVKNTSFCLS